MDKKTNYFVRTMIIALTIALSAMVFFNFTLAEPKYQITAGIVTVAGLIVVLALSESFNKMSLGKILSLSKEVEKKSSENTQVKTENKELRKDLYSMVANIKQSQVNNTYNAPSDEWLRALEVLKTQPEDDKEEEKEQKELLQAAKEEFVTKRKEEREEYRKKRKIRRNAETLVLQKYAHNLSIPESEIIQRAEFSKAFNEIDPIMNKRIVFDGYVKRANIEQFIEVRYKNLSSFSLYDRLYIMLNKIYLYRKAKDVHAELVLILFEIEGEVSEEEQRWIKQDRTLEYFQSAIANKLLKVENITVSMSEIEKYATGGQQSLFK